MQTDFDARLGCNTALRGYVRDDDLMWAALASALFTSLADSQSIQYLLIPFDSATLDTAM